MSEPPNEPFTAADLRALGMSSSDLRSALARNQVRRVMRGVYVDGETPDSTELRIRALSLVVRAGHIACDRTAAWLHGIDVTGSAEPAAQVPIEVCALRWHAPTERPETRARTRDLAREDVHEIDGLLVTSPLRTALDLGCILRRRDALAALDQFRRRFGFTEQELARGAVRFFRRRGVVQLRRLIPLSDPRAESPRETWTRLAIVDAGLPPPVPQHEVEYDGRVLFRLDHAYPAERIAVEYDGAEFHHTVEQVEHDEARRRWLREHGWRVLVVRKGDFTGERLDAWIAELRHALRTAYTNLRW